jgi:hypothetical protein
MSLGLSGVNYILVNLIIVNIVYKLISPQMTSCKVDPCLELLISEDNTSMS